MRNRAFTIKSLLLGGIALLVACCFPLFSGIVLQDDGAGSGYLPSVPLFLIVFLSLGWNMTVGRLRRSLAFSAPELAVVFGLMLVVSWLPSVQHSLVRHMVLPRYEEFTTNASWREARVTTRLPDKLFPKDVDGEAISEEVHFGIIQGDVPLKDVPYAQWVSPLLHWAPLLLLLFIALSAMSFLVHRQWSVHEQLRYPLVSVVDALIQQDGKRPGGGIFRSRLFWAGFLWVFCYVMWNYLYLWFPGQLPKIPSEHSLGWGRLFPSISASNAGCFLLSWMPVSLAMIGIAYFVPGDVSLAMGLTAPLGTLLGVQYYLITGAQVSTGDLDTFRAGGFIALAAILLYTGRSYYFPVLLKALMPVRRSQGGELYGVWAARLLMIGYVLLIVVCNWMGLDWFISWLVVSFMLLAFLVVTRLVCETGVPTIAMGFSLPVILTSLFGGSALGATGIVFVTLLGSTIISASSSQFAMPLVSTGLKLLDDNKVNLRRFAWVSQAAVIVALVGGFAVVLALGYTKGEGNLSKAERTVLSTGVREVLKISDLGQSEVSEAAHGLGKLSLAAPAEGTVGLVVMGALVMVLAYVVRFRFAKWPLHPLFFLVLGTGFAATTWSMFLLGWVIKTLIVKFGGGRVYQQLKPIFVGLIVGQFFSMGVILVVGLIYYFTTGNAPVSSRL